MAKRLSPTFLTLIYEATLKSYWRRQALRRFLRQAGIAESFLSTRRGSPRRYNRMLWIARMTTAAYPSCEVQCNTSRLTSGRRSRHPC